MAAIRRYDLWLLLAAMAVSALLAEGLLRGIGISFPVFHAWDRYTGVAPIPGAEGLWVEEGGPHRVRFNQHGVRDRERTYQKPAGTYRILVSGDSFTEALQVTMEHTYWSVLERRLDRCVPPGFDAIEVLNFGVGATGTAQQLLKLRHHGGYRYRPDLILLAFFSGNDVANNSRALQKTPYIPYFVLRDDTLVLDDTYLRGWMSRWVRPSLMYRGWVRLRQDSRLLQLASRAQGRVRAFLRHRPARSEPRLGLEVGLTPEIYRPPARHRME